MDVVKAVQDYISKIVNGTAGIKVLLLDSHTVRLFVMMLSVDSHYIRCNNTVDVAQS
jgi:hypothetical protein